MFPEDVHYVDHQTGSLYVNASLVPFKNDQYCREIVDDVITTFVCAIQSDTTNYYYAIGFLLSAIGFALTLVVYLCFAKVTLDVTSVLQFDLIEHFQLHGNIHGKIVMCYNVCFLIGYIVLLTTQFIYGYSLLCKSFGNFYIHFQTETDIFILC